MKRIIIFSLIVGIISIGISSCGLAGTSMSDRISYFVDDLNGSRTNIMDNIDPASPGYDNANIAGYWEAGSGNVWDPDDAPFSISNISEGSNSVSGTFVSTLTNELISFEMKDTGDFFSGENWKFWSCTVGTQQF